MEENIDQTLSVYCLPRQHHKHLKSTNCLERLDQGIKRCTHVVQVFPNAESCLRLVRALAVEIHKERSEGTRYLNIEFLKEHNRARLNGADRAAYGAAPLGFRFGSALPSPIQPNNGRTFLTRNGSTKMREGIRTDMMVPTNPPQRCTLLNMKNSL